LIKYEDLGPEFDEWLTAKQLGEEGISLIEEFEQRSNKD